MFYSIPNLRSSSVALLEKPWEWRSSDPRPTFATKAEWSAWCSNPDTRHCFISGIEGVSSSVRVTDKAENPPAVIHATVVDFDMAFDEVHDIERMKTRPPSEYMPAWACKSESGHLRLIWLHEGPLNVSTTKQVEAFRKMQSKKMKWSRWHGGLDKASEKAAMYFEIGKEWYPVCPDAKIPLAILHSWLYEASRSLSFVEGHSYKVPLEEVAKEVEKRFPGRWTGGFQLGAQGVRFWDPQADNTRAAVVHEEGMVCFTGTKGFMGWRDIFGPAWVEQFEGEKIKAIAESLVYDELEDKFWMREEGPSGDQVYSRFSAERLADRLRCLGFSGVPKKGETASEVQKVRDYIVKTRRVLGARPFVYMPSGPMLFNGDMILNTSRVRVIEPAPEGTVRTLEDLKKFAPFIWAWFSEFLEPRPATERSQLEYVLAWMKHTYQNALILKPQPGQALVVVGGREGAGKTYFTSCLLKFLWGGYKDATEYLVHGTQFTDSCLASPLMVVDDTESASDFKVHDRFSALVKKVVANRVQSYNGKFKATGDLLYNGRSVINCNADPMSIQSMPSLDISLHTKVSLLRCNDYSKFSFPARPEVIEEITKRELPYLARFLLEWQIPAAYINEYDKRYYLLSYHHPALFKAASQSGHAYNVLELLTEFMTEYSTHAEHLNKGCWEGTVSTLYRDLEVVPGLASLIRGYKPQNFGRALSVLQSQGYNIEKLETKAHRSLIQWRIPFVIENVQNKLASEREEELLVRADASVTAAREEQT